MLYILFSPKIKVAVAPETALSLPEVSLKNIAMEKLLVGAKII